MSCAKWVDVPAPSVNGKQSWDIVDSWKHPLLLRALLSGDPGRLHSPTGERCSTYNWSLAYLTFFTTSGTVVLFLRHSNPFWVFGKLSKYFELFNMFFCILRIYYLPGWVFFQKDKVLISSGFSSKRAGECSEQRGAEMG